MNGQIYIWRNGLQQLGLLETYKEMIFSTIAEVASLKVSRQVCDQGLEYVHRFLSIPVIFELDNLLIKKFSGYARPFFTSLLKMLPEDPNTIYYYAEHAWIRIMAPEDLLQPHLPLIRNELGHLVAHNPHRDSWFSQATNVINFWVSLARVRHGNSVLIYPESYHQELLTENLQLSKKQVLQPPVHFNMREGDVLIFHGDHLHSSELNITRQTRFVLSYRLTYGAPAFTHHEKRFNYKIL